MQQGAATMCQIQGPPCIWKDCKDITWDLAFRRLVPCREISDQDTPPTLKPGECLQGIVHVQEGGPWDGPENPIMYCGTHLREVYPSHFKVEQDWKATPGTGDKGTGSGQGTGQGGQNPKDDDLEPNYTW